MSRLPLQFICLILVLIPVCINAGSYAYKYLSGPPDQFPQFYPEYFPVNSDLLLLPVSSISTNSSGEYIPFPVDKSDKMFLSVLLPVAKHSKWVMKRVSVYLKTPSGLPVVSLSVAQEVVSISDNFKYLCKSYTVSYPKTGTWQAKITLRKSLLSNLRGRVESYPVYVLVGYDGSQIIVESQIASVQRYTLVNRPVFINVNITMPAYDGQSQLIPKLSMFQSNLAVIQPDGLSYDEEINMDRFQLSRAGRNELQLTGVFLPPIGGVYKIQVNVSGETQSGIKFARTQWHLVGVSSNILSYKEFNTFTLDNEYFRVELHLTWNKGMDSTYRIFSEVWAIVNGDLIPICWIVHLTDIEQNSTGSYFLPVYIHSKWILQYSIPPDTLFLRNVSIEDVNIFTTILEIKIMKVDLTTPSFDSNSASILYRTRNSCKQKAKKSDSINYATKQPNLVLVHGYCAQETPFTLENFTDFIVFEDWDQSLSNDQFARHIIDFTKERNLSAFSIVAHSQGGLASVHLYAYYETGLDSYSVSGSGSDRKIQTVGSPYLGTPLAGLLADIGYFFGIKCGSNLELTYEGAQAWLSKVPLEVQYDVHFYRTLYGKRKKYCNFGTNVVLKGPNDGLVEVGKARLPFGRGEGISPGECHSVNMQWPSQCKNPRRNAEMNKYAARP